MDFSDLGDEWVIASRFRFQVEENVGIVNPDIVLRNIYYLKKRLVII